MAPLTSDDVLNVKFQVSSFKEGYNQDEVDVFLDEVTTTMRGLEERLAGPMQSRSHRFAEITVTSRDVRNIRLGTTRWSGYNVEEVDAFLDQVVAAMETLEAQLSTGSFLGQSGSDAGAGGAYGGGTYGAGAGQTGYAPAGAGANSSQCAEAIAQRDQYITQLQQENAYLRAELESAQRRLEMFGAQPS